MRHQIAFHQYNPKKPYCYRIFCKSLNDVRFPNTYKYAAKLPAWDEQLYIRATVDYVKYLVQDMEKQQSIKGRISIESANRPLAGHIKIVGTFQKGRQSSLSELVETKHRD